MKLVVPVPIAVKSSLVGIGLVDQHTPFSVIAPPPSEVMVPPETAVVVLIDETIVVVRVAFIAAPEENVSSRPYAVPALLVAYAR